jgi:hypothetical protein
MLGAFIVLCISQKQLRNVFWHIVLGLGMSAFFWSPALAERSFVQFDSAVVSVPSQYFLSVKDMTFLGMTTVLSIMLYFVLPKKKRLFEMVIIGIILFGYMMALPISGIFWNSPLLTKLVQFPFRFLMLPILFGPWILTYVVDALAGWKRWVVIALFITLLLPVAIELPSVVQFVSRPIGYYTTNEGTTTVANEYMPTWVADVPKNRTVDVLDVISGNADLSQRVFRKDIINVGINAKETSIIQINKVYYPGWMVNIDGVPIPINHQNEFGFMRVTVPTGVHTMKAIFRETPFRFVIDLLSFVAFLLYVIFLRQLK